MTYSEKLRDPRWQKKRLEILSRDNFTCDICADNKTELHVHHKKYYKDPWDVKNEDLQTLCKNCHYVIENVDVDYIEAVGIVFANKIKNGLSQRFIVNPNYKDHG